MLYFVIQGGLGDQKDTGSSGILKRTSPTPCPGVTRSLPGSFLNLDIRNPGKQAELASSFRAAQGQNVPQAERQPLSSHIPVPRNRYGGWCGHELFFLILFFFYLWSVVIYLFFLDLGVLEVKEETKKICEQFRSFMWLKYRYLFCILP